MTPRDLYFATYHQAAHVITALVLGCGVDYVEIGNASDKIGWNLDCASLGDAETVCGAGYEMEIILGRRHELSWSRASDDRALIARIRADRLGEVLTSVEIDERFNSGATSSRSIIEHGGVRRAIDELAEHLSEAYLKGERRIEAQDLRAITAQVTGAVPRI